jgi:hypothetical protein
MIDAERGSATPPDREGFAAQVQPCAATSHGPENIRQRSTRTTADIEQVMRRFEAKPFDVGAEIVPSDPRVLTDVLAVGLRPDAPHQRRVELVVDGIVRLTLRAVGRAHVMPFAAL